MYSNFLTALAPAPIIDRGLFHIECYTGNEGRVVLSQCEFNVIECDIELATKLDIQVPESVRRGVKKRQAEFVAGRYLSKLCMRELVGTYSHVAIGAHREPLWPDGLEGAISHTKDRAVALVAERSIYPFVGIDVEYWLGSEMNLEIASLICNAREQKFFIEQGLSHEEAVSIIFSAKESLFKATFPFIGQYFGFESACVVEFNRLEKTLILALELPLAKKCMGQRFFRCHFFSNGSTITTVILGDRDKF